MQYSKRFNFWLKPEEALALEKEQSGREVVKFNIEDMAAAIKAESGAVTPPYANPANAIPYSIAHPSGPTPLLPPSADYDKVRARSGSNGSKSALLAVHAAYIGENPTEKSSFALPHHLSQPPHACNLKAVKSCLKALSVKLPASGIVPTAHPLASTNPAVDHLLQHLSEFKKAAEQEQNGA